MQTLIIAEAGVNHNGDLDVAYQMIEVAAKAGADYVKFQTFDADRIVSKNAPKARYQGETTDPGETQHTMIRRLQLDRSMHERLIAHCEMHDIGFLSAGFDIESIDLLMELGLDRFKIPSGEITNLPYLRHVGRCARPIILSTGMARLGDIEAALDVLVKAGTPREEVILLHCNTEYPTAMKDVNLRAMVTMRHTFGLETGYSDHTLGIEVPVAAVALGAQVIEKHFTLNRNLSGPDQRASLEPGELGSMVRAIRNIEQALGDGIKRPTDSEAQNMPVARKSIVAACEIRAGDPFTELNLTVKRPGTGVSPMLWDEVLGRKAPRDFLPDELVEL